MVTKNLRTWFVIHFIADFLFGIPLLIAPVWMLTLFGWPNIDPFTARLVGAALIGIGGESLLGRNANADTFRAMLNLKLLWASTAIIGMVTTLMTGNYPLIGWGIVGIFVIFFFVWLYYRLQLREGDPK
ncbi:MAG: hypothetical protein ISR59_05170 [Anaerolineales bacterium]|uniref:Uncharacterized protein n=1 Tax=Candidatus Desulfolinea nitratireducens TaxID=2841698 RepID=A0A8J6NLP2_9CHLR|nr:hypothetical protein [Candidatus Desulfolinea nitratireducens]MBL6960480.1 hypothetical protein [Anaerolineales bacterium]